LPLFLATTYTNGVEYLEHFILVKGGMYDCKESGV
jgi:hypothetical protein